MLFGLLFVLLASNFTAPTPSALAQTAGPATSVTAPIAGACYKGGGQTHVTWLIGPNSNHTYISYHGGDSNSPIHPTQTNISGGHPVNGLSLADNAAITASTKFMQKVILSTTAVLAPELFPELCVDSSGPSAPVLSRRCVYPTCGGIAPSTEIIWSISTDTGCEGLTGYEVFRDDKHIAYTQINSFTDTDVAAGKTYRYKVSAYDDFGFANSNILSVTTGVAPQTQPPAPTNLTLKIAKTGNG